MLLATQSVALSLSERDARGDAVATADLSGQRGSFNHELAYDEQADTALMRNSNEAIYSWAMSGGEGGGAGEPEVLFAPKPAVVQTGVIAAGQALDVNCVSVWRPPPADGGGGAGAAAAALVIVSMRRCGASVAIAWEPA